MSLDKIKEVVEIITINTFCIRNVKTKPGRNQFTQTKSHSGTDPNFDYNLYNEAILTEFETNIFSLF